MRMPRDLSDAELYSARQYALDGYEHSWIARMFDVKEGLSRLIRNRSRGHEFLWDSDPWRCVLRPPRWTPDCMTETELALWNSIETGGLKRPCDACPWPWAIEMRMQGRCNGVPADSDEAEAAA